MEHSLSLSAGGCNAEIFPGQPPKSWILWPPWRPPIQDILAGSLLYLQVNNYKLQILSLLINNLLTSASSSSSSSRLSSDSSKSSSLLLGLEGGSYAAEWLNLLRVLVYYFFSRASTDFWSAGYMAIILLKSVATSVNPICPGLFERI